MTLTSASNAAVKFNFILRALLQVHNPLISSGNLITIDGSGIVYVIPWWYQWLKPALLAMNVPYNLMSSFFPFCAAPRCTDDARLIESFGALIGSHARGASRQRWLNANTHTQ